MKRTRRDSLERLKRRINKRFLKVKFIGDIPITDDEFLILKDYFIQKVNLIVRSDSHLIIDPVYSTALVQLGIRYYSDGNFWSNIFKGLGMVALNPVKQSWIRESFIATLLKFEKLTITGDKGINNILMHGFVSDYYADDLFEFLFAYYRIDLERDIERFDSSAAKYLFESMVSAESAGRTHYLKRQVIDALKVNPKGCKVRIRRILRMIDGFFWNDIQLHKTNSRITSKFYTWVENSNEFKSEYNETHGASNMTKGRKKYSTPHLKYNFIDNIFTIEIPSQLIPFEFLDTKYWKVTYGLNLLTITDNPSVAISGLKTMHHSIQIQPENIFDSITIEMYSGTQKIKVFKIKNDSVRFYDKHGEMVNSDILGKGEFYSFTNSEDFIKSEALISTEKIGELMFSYYNFQHGDIIILPNNKPISVGKKIEEGIQQRNLITGATAFFKDNNKPIYRIAPLVILKISKSKLKGTLIKLNEVELSIYNKQTKEIAGTEFDVFERNENIGLLLNLSNYGCNEDGIYKIYVDVPGDRTVRIWEFALIKNFDFHFEESPYFFMTRGTIRFNQELSITSTDEGVTKLKLENVFNFENQPNLNNLKFDVKTGNSIICTSIDIPVLKWSFNSTEWNVEKPSEIWHADFPNKILIKFPSNKIKLFVDESIENEDDHYELFYKSSEKDIFECDMTKFKSWIDREILKHKIHLEIDSKIISFFDVITKSLVISNLISADYKKSEIKCKFEILGKSNYYVDISYENKMIVDKEKLEVDGMFSKKTKLMSGKYTVCVFEEDYDDTGFGDHQYYQIGKYESVLINPYDLSGRELLITSLKKNTEGRFIHSLNNKYKINKLEKIESNALNQYKGVMSVVIEGLTDRNQNGFPVDVIIEFPDLEKLNYAHVSFADDDEFIVFLFDKNQKNLVLEEKKELKPSEKYRRYIPVYPEDFKYHVTFNSSQSSLFESIYGIGQAPKK